MKSLLAGRIRKRTLEEIGLRKNKNSFKLWSAWPLVVLPPSQAGNAGFVEELKA